MPYPSTVTSFTNPLPGDKLNAPSHSSIETAQNTGLTELQTFVGTLSSAVGTLVYDIRAAASNGGGHVQTVNKGGTGQTTYTKGDLLVATSASVLAKFAVGLDGQTLVSDSSVAAGIKWSSQNTFSNKIEVNGSVRTIGASVAANSDQSIFGVVIPGSTLGTSNAVRTTLFVTDFGKATAASSVYITAQYGSNVVSSVLIGGNMGGLGASSYVGTITYDLAAASSSVLQRSNLVFNLFGASGGKNGRFTVGPTPTSFIGGVIVGTGSVNTSSDQILGMSIRYEDNATANGLTLNGYTVEKIA